MRAGKRMSIFFLMMTLAGLVWGDIPSDATACVLSPEYAADVHALKNAKVYVTRFGSKYHSASHYANRSRPITLYRALSSGYGPCRVCGMPGRHLPQKPLSLSMVYPARVPQKGSMSQTRTG